MFETKTEEPHWIFIFKEKETNKEKKLFYGLLNIHFIETSKYDGIYDSNTMVDKFPWILFLNNPNDAFFLLATYQMYLRRPEMNYWIYKMVSILKY